ncbi:MAG: methyltransferase domain-containing protein [Thermoproteota archaeon]|nr:methyltransferase domain-containing protein [Thermoproteota archaeon]MDQ3966969.1 methyltransferase domain-containing protein [Thermoproteota archaeon]
MNEREKMEQWQLEESAAESYERYLVPLFFAPGAQYLIELAALKEGERVLDLACGTGIVARSAASKVGTNGMVVGLDRNEGMLAVARKASPDISPLIKWRQGDARSIPFPDATFDIVFCQQGLQFFPDRSDALREAYRVLAPNGRFVLSAMRSIKHNPEYNLLADVLERYIGSDAGTMMRSPFLPLSTNELRDLLKSAAFKHVRILIGIGPVRYPSVREFLHREMASSPLAAQIKSLSDDMFRMMVHDLEVALEAHMDDDGIVFPAEIYFAIAQR